MTTDPRRGDRPGLALRLLLRLLPAHLREEHERELAQYLRLLGPAGGVRARVRRGLALLVDIVRAAPGAHLDVLRQDAAVAVRQLRRAPGFALTAVLTLAIGIGGTVALFSVVDAVLLQPLPYPEADRLVTVSESNVERGFIDFGISPADFQDLTADERTFVGAAAYQSRSGTVLVGEVPERVVYAAVSAAFFDVVGVRTAYGRTFTPDDDVQGGTSVVVSHEFWTGPLGGVPDAVGRTIRLDGVVYRIVGIMPPAFGFPGPTVALWTPLGLTAGDRERRGARWLTAIARLRGGVDAREADARVAARSGRLADTYPANHGWTASVHGLQASIVADARLPILLAWGAAALILLIAAANVTNLYLGRALAREGEMALRGALGARPGRIGRQLVTEGLVLAVAGGAAGLGVAAVLIGQLRAVGAGVIPRVGDVALNLRAVGATLGLVLLSTVLFSLLPALSGSRVDLRRVMDSSRRSGDRRHGRWQALFVAAEAAIAVMVVVASALLVRSLVRVLQQPLGITPAGVVTFRVEPPWQTDVRAPDGFARLADERASAAAAYTALAERLSAIPGVAQVGAVNRLPLAGNWWASSVSIVGREADGEDQRPSPWVRVVTPEYLTAIGTRVVRGRGLLPSDGAAAERVVVIDEAFARMFWRDGDPIGSQLRLAGPPGADMRARIVGVAEAVHMNQLDAPLRPTLYVAFAQGLEGHYLNWGMDVVVRRTGSADLSSAIRAAVADAFPGTPAFGIRTLEDQVRTSVAPRVFQVVTIGAFAVAALLLTLVGVYGVLALAVRERTREYGIRRALGASPGSILRQVLWRGTAMVGGGVLVGTAVTVAGTRLLASLVYGVTVTDPLALAAGPVTIMLLATVAAASAARHAMRSDPARVLRDS